MRKGRKLLAAIVAFCVILTAAPLSPPAQAASLGESLVNYGKKFMGVKYRFGGTTPSGFDCSGFTQYVYKNHGISIPRTTDQQYRVGTFVSKSQLQPGDLVFFKNTYRRGISHVGIYAGGNLVLNATSSDGIDLVSLSNGYWGPRYAGAKRIIDGKFKDVPKNSLSYTAIDELTDKNIIQGFKNYTFKPNDPVTRGQAAAFINRVLKRTPANINHFKDVSPSNPFSKDIAAIRESGIITGFSDGRFKPYDYISRTEMAVIAKKAFDLSHGNAAAASNRYSDVRSNSWAFDAITTMKAIDKTGVFKTDKYNGPRSASRAVFTTALYNAMNAD
ncbi:C40 family peptidase [Bacillus xiapuensis]|uniref:C40 family peptidase n=1 Tax=Bacillus xiapuensis TaxID=2014075 RepID=UPI000C239ECF|nr:C40 family peptidase [Bacillus xiapuensis]